MSQVELHILQPGHPERRLVLPEGVVHVGRGDDNEVVLADVGVSRRHARLEVSAEGVVVEDLGSGNGTWFRGQAVRRQVLGDGEEVAIDPFTLRVQVHATMEAGEITAGRDGTSPMPDAAPLALLTVTSAHRMPVRVFPLPFDGVLTLGRSDRNAIVLPEPASSRVHAEVRCEGGRFTLRDHGSSNGTFVNGRRVKERPLEEGDRIRIGAVELRFSLAGESEGTEAFVEPLVAPPAARPLPPPPPPPPATTAFLAPLPPAVEEIEVNPVRGGGKRLRSTATRKSTGFFSRPINLVSIGVLGLTFVMVGGKVASEVLTGMMEARATDTPAPTSAIVAPADAATTAPIMADGMRHFAEGHYFEAAGSFYRVLQVDPDNVDARRMGYAACEFITFGEIRASLLARSTTDASRSAAKTAALDAITKLAANELSPPAARAALDAALALAPDDAELRAALVALDSQTASAARAASAGRAAAATRDLESRLAEAQADLSQGKLSRAVRGFEDVMAADPGRVSPQYHSAQEGVRQAKDRMKAESKAAWMEANAALKSGNALGARKLLLQVVATDPYNGAAVAKLAEARATLKQQASETYKEARTLEGLGQNEKAIALYHKVQSYVGDDADALSQKAKARSDALLR